jgi:hypothetical protein
MRFQSSCFRDVLEKIRNGREASVAGSLVVALSENLHAALTMLPFPEGR